MYRSGLASVINGISQPFPAYVSPRRLNNKLGCKRRANERLFAKSGFMRETLFSRQNFTWKKPGIIKSSRGEEQQEKNNSHHNVWIS